MFLPTTRENSLLEFSTMLHFSVDGVCAACLADYAVNEPDYANIVYIFGLYSLVAFGGQWFTGLILDKHKNFVVPSLAIVPVILAGGFVEMAGIFWQAVLIALGNCLFHVAAGIIVLERYKGFKEPGILVSSGAVGLGLGLNQIVGILSFWIVCVAFTVLAILTVTDSTQPSAVNGYCGGSDRKILPLMAGTVLLLSCVVLRGFGGKSDIPAPVMVMPCVFMLGKSAGGILCDLLGWRKTILVIFLMSFSAAQIPGIVGIILLSFAFNMTMPLTLRLLQQYFPGHPGLTFGLAAGCLLPGAFFGENFMLPAGIMAAVQFMGLFFAGIIFTNSRGNGLSSPQF